MFFWKVSTKGLWGAGVQLATAWQSRTPSARVSCNQAWSMVDQVLADDRQVPFPEGGYHGSAELVKDTRGHPRLGAVLDVAQNGLLHPAGAEAGEGLPQTPHVWGPDAYSCLQVKGSHHDGGGVGDDNLGGDPPMG